MFRLSHLITAKTMRPCVKFNLLNQLGRHQYLVITQRCYSKNKDDKVCRKTEPIKELDKSKLSPSECRPKEARPCKPPKATPCDRKAIPSLQECIKPNLMSDCPKPDCAWEAAEANARRRNRAILLLGLLLAAISVGALIYVLDKKQPTEVKKKKVLAKHRKGVAVKIPPSSQDIPSEVPYLLVGGGTASFSAFRAIKSADPLAKVLVITNDGFYPYMRPPLSKEIWYNEETVDSEKLEFKQWNGSQRSLFYEPEDFYIQSKDLLASANGGVAVARGWTITHIDVVAREAYLEDGHVIKYDKCLLATGASPRNLDVFEVADEKVRDNVTVYRNIYDFEYLNETLNNAKSLAIIGGGFLGSELACSIAHKMKKNPKFKIYQIFKEGGNLGHVLPEYLSFWTTDKVKTLGVEVLLNTEVTAAVLHDDRIRLTLSNGDPLTVDKVIVAVGVQPNTEMAEKSDLEIDPDFGGFLVNTELQARSNLFIAGDCACFYDVKLGRRRVEHHDHAVISGRLAGENMTGAGKPYLHQSMFWSDLGPDVGFEAIGIVDSKLPTVGVFAKATDKDNPKAVVTTTDEGLRASSEEIPEECKKYAGKSKATDIKGQEKRRALSKTKDGEDFGKGIIFYLRDDIVVGILLWNVFNRMQVARQVLSDEKKYDDLNEVAKLFNIHEE